MAGSLPTCRSCGASITWGLTAAGKRMPLDAEPAPTGNVFLGYDGNARVLNKEALEEARLTDAPLYLSHHVSCPHGQAWKR